MKDILQTVLTGLGCTPLLAIGLFLAGAIIGEFVVVDSPAPPAWFLLLAMGWPLCFGLFVRSIMKQKEIPRWLERWQQQARKKKIVGQSTRTVEQIWLENQFQQRTSKVAIQGILDNATLWGWASVATCFPLAYICIWIGLMVAQRG